MRQSGVSHAVEVVVVDNDPEGSARGVVAEFATGHPFRVSYFGCIRVGVSAARNAAIDWASSASLLVFIDDDEWADDRWLCTLLSCPRQNPIGVVQGAVRTLIPEGGPDWAADAAGPFRSRSVTEARLLRTAFAGNVLIDLARLRDEGFRFDDRFGRVGGEDTEFFARLSHAGWTIVAAPDAVVYEDVPLERQTLAWVWHRHFRSAATWVVVEREILQSPGWRVRRAASALRDVAGSAWSACRWGLGRSAVHKALATELAAKAAGTLCAMCGIVSDRYAPDS